MDDTFTVILANTAAWFFRLWYDRSGAKSDFFLIFVFCLWTFKIELLSLIPHLIVPAALVIAIIVPLFLRNALHLGNSWSREERNDHENTSEWQAMRPLVFPCRTTHTRIFPKKHSFSYSYLFVGIPVGWQGSVGSFLSADLKSFSRRTKKYPHTSKFKSWFSVEAEDHLSRGSHVDGLKGKLNTYLKSEVGHWEVRCFNRKH